jgi:hypothetical protein
VTEPTDKTDFPPPDTSGPPRTPVDPWHNVELWPILHGVLEFAVAIRQRLVFDPPDAIAVELPETLANPVGRAVSRLPHLSMVHYVTPRGPVYLPVEPTDAIMEGLRFGGDHSLPVYLVDRDTEHYPLVTQGVPDPAALSDIGYEAYCRAWIDTVPDQENPDPEAAAEDALRESTMAFHLQRLAKKHERIVFICGLDHVQHIRARLDEPQVRPMGRLRREDALPYALDPDASREVTGESPYLMNAYEKWRPESRADEPGPRRTTVQLQVIQEARKNHLKNSGDEISTNALAVLRRFSRNYALIEGRLAPDFFQLLVASRGAVDDNFAYEVWDLGTHYDHHEEPPSLQTISPSVEDLYRYSRTLRFHRTIGQRRRQLRLMTKQRKREKYPGEWKDQWEPGMICSHQPEDIAVESYGAFLMKKGKKILSEEQTRTEPFSTSLLDGIDVRETVRNWHQKKIYVRENRPVKGKVGAVVVIFDADDDANGANSADGTGEKYPWTMTWQGEHEQESDMALYATPMGDHLTGPGISRSEYGGFLLTYPPGRMFHVWEDPFFNAANTKPERLLMAAIDYCAEHHIVYVAAKPPRAFFKALASRFGKKIIYLPIGQLSPVTLKKIRVFHVLAGHQVRDHAQEYIY